MALLIYLIIVPVPFCCSCKKYCLNNAKVARHQEISLSQCNLSSAVICSLMPGLNQLGRRLLSDDFFQRIGAWCLLKVLPFFPQDMIAAATKLLALPCFFISHLLNLFACVQVGFPFLHAGEILYSFTIVTTSSSSSLEWLHDRMPVILGNKESTDSWLNDAPLSNLDKILKPYEGTDLAWYPVTTAIGKISFDGPECIKEIQIKTEETKSISQFFSKKDTRAKPPIKSEPVEATEETTEQESVKNELENWSTLENKRMKAEPVQIGQQKSAKEEPESQFTLDNTTVKAEPVQNSQQKSVKEEPQSQSTPQNSRMEGEPDGNSHHKSVKEEHDESQDDYHQTTTKKDDGDNTSNISTLSPKRATSSTEKRDYAKFSAHAKPSAKETERQHTTPVKKKSKGADDKQPTLFSYFGRS
ncbi:UNVERIFIED_CONTAM: hypothetical protein Sradi_1211200 [Sesamum radiatum]|uniref:Embryonic stem cell-specific 5-hydroxymethylcytosine-binding protein n=1 Tax=Sesamum radiatum TaxID=300843 RepID=A0AAW2UNP1_SESRA